MICYFVRAYLGAILGPIVPVPLWWVGTFLVFMALNMVGVALTFRVTLISLAVLLLFCIAALPHVDFARWAMNIAPYGIELSGLVASLHAVLFAQGRQVFVLSGSGYLPRFLSVIHSDRKTPIVAMIFGCGIRLAFMVGLTAFSGSKGVSDARIGGLLLNMAVFAAMLSYLSRAAAFLVLRWRHADLPRPFVSPFGVAGA